MASEVPTNLPEGINLDPSVATLIADIKNPDNSIETRASKAMTLRLAFSVGFMREIGELNNGEPLPHETFADGLVKFCQLLVNYATQAQLITESLGEDVDTQKYQDAETLFNVLATKLSNKDEMQVIEIVKESPTTSDNDRMCDLPDFCNRQLYQLIRKYSKNQTAIDIVNGKTS